MSTVQQAYALARSGRFSNLASVKQHLTADGHRAVDVLLGSRTIRDHLEAICAATFRPQQTQP